MSLFFSESWAHFVNLRKVTQVQHIAAKLLTQLESPKGIDAKLLANKYKCMLPISTEYYSCL